MEEPPELPTQRGDRAGRFFSGGGPDDILLVNKRFRQG